MTGSVSYEITDVFVKLDMKVYKALATAPIDAEKNSGNVTTLQKAGDSISVDDYAQLTGHTDTVSTYDPEAGTVTDQGTELKDSYTDLDLIYGAPSTENQGYAFYIVVDITNYGTETVNAKVTNNTTGNTQNTNFYNTNGVNISPRTGETYSTGRVVIGMSLVDPTLGASGAFSYTVTVERGSATFGYDNVLFNSATTAVVESVNVDGATTTYDTPTAFANMEPISLNSDTIGAKEEKTVKITLKAKDSNSAYQRLKLTYSNLPQGLRVNSTSIFLPQDGTEKVYTIKFYNETTEDIPLEDVRATISLENEPNLLMHEPKDNYYYVEMGTVMRDTENEYIRWRYISADGENPIGTSTVSSLNGTYILETDLVTEYLSEVFMMFMETQGELGELTLEQKQQKLEEIDNYLANNYTGTLCAFQSAVTFDLETGAGINTEYNTNSNDYKTSTIRRYMNYTGDNKVVKHASWQDAGPRFRVGELTGTSINIKSNGQATNMVTDLNIDIKQDIIYNEIFARSLTDDLYADIGASDSNDETGTPVKEPSVIVDGLSDTNSDKFWLLSVAEANTLFTSDGERDWNESEQTDVCWLRSPEPSYAIIAFHVDTGGDIYCGNDVVFFFAARPAFQIS